MKHLNYEEEIVKRRLFELEEPINGEKRWIRVSRNGALDHWKPVSAKEKVVENLNGERPDDEVKKELELKFKRTHYYG